MGPKTYSGLYILFIFLGVLLIDNVKLRKYEDKKYYLVKLGIFFIFMIPLIILLLIDFFTEKGYTLYKLFNYYDLKYGDKLDFIYHIKTRYKKDNTEKTPKCKIEGKIENNNLKITKMEGCDEDEEVKNNYLKLLTHTGKFEGDQSIKVGSEMKNFTWE